MLRAVALFVLLFVVACSVPVDSEPIGEAVQASVVTYSYAGDATATAVLPESASLYTAPSGGATLMDVVWTNGATGVAASSADSGWIGVNVNHAGWSEQFWVGASDPTVDGALVPHEVIDVATRDGLADLADLASGDTITIEEDKAGAGQKFGAWSAAIVVSP